MPTKEFWSSEIWNGGNLGHSCATQIVRTSYFYLVKWFLELLRAKVWVASTGELTIGDAAKQINATDKSFVSSLFYCSTGTVAKTKLLFARNRPKDPWHRYEFNFLWSSTSVKSSLCCLKVESCVPTARLLFLLKNHHHGIESVSNSSDGALLWVKTKKELLTPALRCFNERLNQSEQPTYYFPHYIGTSRW